MMPYPHKYEIKYLIAAQKAAIQMEIEKKKLIEINRQKAQEMLTKILATQVSYTSTGNIDYE